MVDSSDDKRPVFTVKHIGQNGETSASEVLDGQSSVSLTDGEWLLVATDTMMIRPDVTLTSFSFSVDSPEPVTVIINLIGLDNKPIDRLQEEVVSE